MNALGQAIAQQQFNALVDVMTYEELYEYFGGALFSSSSYDSHLHLPVQWNFYVQDN